MLGCSGREQKVGNEVSGFLLPHPRRPSTPGGRKPPTTKPLLPLNGGAAKSECGPQVGLEHMQMRAHGEGTGGAVSYGHHLETLGNP